MQQEFAEFSLDKLFNRTLVIAAGDTGHGVTVDRLPEPDAVTTSLLTHSGQVHHRREKGYLKIIFVNNFSITIFFVFVLNDCVLALLLSMRGQNVVQNK